MRLEAGPQGGGTPAAYPGWGGAAGGALPRDQIGGKLGAYVQVVKEMNRAKEAFVPFKVGQEDLTCRTVNNPRILCEQSVRRVKWPVASTQT